MNEGKKIFWKHWTGVLVLVAMAVFVLALLLNLNGIIDAVVKGIQAASGR